ncbi:UNVERIFIED_CONTAM: hypothetical protein DES50_101249 [Williamsia faeni]
MLDSTAQRDKVSPDSGGSTASTVLIAHHSAELYGSDRMVLESVRALVQHHRVVVALPETGELVGLLRAEGAEVLTISVPVLRHAILTPRGLAGFVLSLPSAVRRMVRTLKQCRVDALYVNTKVIPIWIIAGLIARVPTLCHVHEAEDGLGRAARAILALPLRLTRTVVVNSRASGRSIGRQSSRLIYNGVAGPPIGAGELPRATLASPVRLTLVGRWSPGKGTDVAVKAVRLLNERGTASSLRLVGGVYPGKEWFEDKLRSEADSSVEFVEFRNDVWGLYADSDIVLVPSRAESFGNVAVEGMLAGRPVIAAATQGLVEIVKDGETGLLVAADNPEVLADAIERLVADWPGACAIAQAGRQAAVERFGLVRYQREIQTVVGDLIPDGARAAR